MNDFTKEELEDIQHVLEDWRTPVCDNDTFVKLREKLQSMIDKYCEQDNACEHDWGVGFGSIHSPVTYCKKCYCQKPSLPNDIFEKTMGINK